MTEESYGDGELPTFDSVEETRLTLSEALNGVEEIRVTLHHACGKRVDVADKHLELDGETVVFRHPDVYDDLYADESDSNEYRVVVEWREDK